MKTSKEDFKYFQQQCEIWLDKLSLRDWKVYYFHQTEKGSFAWMNPDCEGKVVSIGLSIDWVEENVTKEFLKQVSRHEVLHVLLADLVQTGKYRQSCDADFTESQHAVIRRLENIL